MPPSLPTTTVSLPHIPTSVRFDFLSSTLRIHHHQFLTSNETLWLPASGLVKAAELVWLPTTATMPSGLAPRNAAISVRFASLASPARAPALAVAWLATPFLPCSHPLFSFLVLSTSKPHSL